MKRLRQWVSLLALVLCLPGVAAEAPVAVKKGVGHWARHMPEAVDALGCGWYYNWTPQPFGEDRAIRAEFVPMIWSDAHLKDRLQEVAAQHATHLLGFNEPDGKDQANMTVARAVELWPQLMATGLRLGSPAPTTGNRWLDDFMAEAQRRHLRVDFLCLHWYGDITANDPVGALRRYLQKYYDRYHLPIWLTEFSGADFSYHRRPTTVADNAAFARDAAAMLETLPFVERYAWFSSTWEPKSKSYSAVGLYDAKLKALTPVGAAYRAAGGPARAGAAVAKPDDPFFAHFQPVALPPPVPFAFHHGDRLAICGDSITEAARYSRMLETYLAVCVPELGVTVRTHGKGGEKSDQFLKRLPQDVLSFRPTVATLCYGMNDHGYVNDRGGGFGRKFHTNYAHVVQGLLDAHVRVVVSSPGCIGKLPPWDFVKQYHGTEEGLNLNLCGLRNHTVAIAEQFRLPYVDTFWNLFTARFDARQRFGPEYALCGHKDGVHPLWAGHVVMVYGFFKALGFDGDLGTIRVDLAARTATATKAHTVTGCTADAVTLVSRSYPYCAEGSITNDDSIRSGMALVPFNRDFNRLILKVSGATAKAYQITWGPTAREYTAAQLGQGINLAEDFAVNPFSEAFRKVDEAVLAKQTYEAKQQTWKFQGADQRPAAEREALVQRSEAERAKLVEALAAAVVPVTHTIRITAQ